MSGAGNPLGYDYRDPRHVVRYAKLVVRNPDGSTEGKHPRDADVDAILARITQRDVGDGASLARATGNATGDSTLNPFDNLFGDPSANTTLAEADLRRVARRAQRLAGRGVQPAGVAGIRARASDRAELARAIGEALQARDVVRTQALIQEGAALFGHAAMVDAVELQARQTQQDQMAEHYPAMDAARDVEEPYHAPGLEDRQRRNLEQFDDVAELSGHGAPAMSPGITAPGARTLTSRIA